MSVLRLSQVIDNDFEQLIESLLDLAQKSELKRSRLCVHPKDDSDLHVMAVCLSSESHVRIHKHPKSEFYMILFGIMEIITFDGNQIELERKTLSATSNHIRERIYYMQSSHYHRTISITDHVIFLECVSGPFDSNSSQYP